MEASPRIPRRSSTAEAFLDAAERLLITVGHAGITTRRLAAEAGANQGLVHYYFGSIDELFVQVLERFTDRLVARQREMYGAEDVSFIERWRTAWRFQEEDLEAGYSKIWMELQALSWNRPDLRPRVDQVNAEWRSVLREAYGRAASEYGLGDEFCVEALVTLTMTFGQGFALERLEGISNGHGELLDWIEGWLESLEETRRRTA